jgi:phosphate transport system substrate-binding protein
MPKSISGEIQMYANKNNDMAVSPIVATLVLIVVAVIGAVAVGTIMGTFSSDVSKQANANGAGTAAQSEIIVAGSTTIDPITQLMGKAYSLKNPGVKITSQSMGSGAGVAAALNGVADIGAASEAIPAKWTNTWPNLKSNLIGYGAIVVITNSATPGFVNTTTKGISAGDLAQLYSAAPTLATTNGTWDANPVPVSRADSSGTQDTFFQQFVFPGTTSNPSGVKNATSANGNAGMIATVGSTAGAIGFADYGDVVTNLISGKTVKILPIENNAGTVVYGTTLNTQDSIYTTNSQTQKNWFTLRDGAKYVYERDYLPAYNYANKDVFPTTLYRPLYYITAGSPSSGVQSFISFAANQPVDSDKKINIFQETNNFNIADLG